MFMPALRWSWLAVLSGALLLLPDAHRATTVQRTPLVPDSAFQLPDSVRAVLSAVTRVVVAPDSSIYLADMRYPAILHLEPNGNYRRVVGGPGSGPGEFHTVIMLGLYRDSLWAMDPGQVRVTLFPLNGPGQRTMPYGPYAPKATLPGAISRRGLPASILPDGSFLLEEGTPDPSRPTNGLLLRADHTMRVLDTVTRLPSAHSRMVFIYRDGESHLSQPFSDDPIYSVSVDGSLVVLVSRRAATNEDESEFTVIGMQNGSKEIFRRTIQYQPRRLTSRTVDSAASSKIHPIGEWQRSPVTFDSVRRRIYRPAFYPPVTQVRAGRDGSTWLRVNFADSPTGTDEWMQLSPTGLPQRRVTTPLGFRLLEADLRHVWGTFTDSLDVPEVKRYKLDRAFAN